MASLRFEISFFSPEGTAGNSPGRQGKFLRGYQIKEHGRRISATAVTIESLVGNRLPARCYMLREEAADVAGDCVPIFFKGKVPCVK